jgi:hypothetical protein
MTRETKLGLAVGTSFLSLVTVVAVNTWRKSEPPPPAPEVTPPMAHASTLTPRQEGKGARPSEVIQASVGEPANPGPNLPPEQPSAPSPGAPPLLPATQSPPIVPNRPSVSLPAPNPAPVPPSPVLPASSGKPELPLQVEAPPVLPKASSMPEAPPVPKESPVSAQGKQDIKESTSQQGGTNDVEAPATKSPILPSLPTTATVEVSSAAAAAGTANEPTTGPPPQKDNVPEASIGPAPLPPGLNGQKGPAGALVTGVVDLPKGPSASEVKPVPDKGVADEVPVTTVSPQVNKTPVTPEIANTASQVGAAPPQAGSQSPLATAPIAVPTVPPPAAGGEPQVITYEEHRYVCKADDIDFKAVSKKELNSEVYADALIEFNRNHMLGRDAVKQAPKLQPGMVVYVPRIEVLEEQYGKFIPGFRPMPVQKSTAEEPGPMAPAKPLPSMTATPSAPAAVPVVTAPAASANTGTPPPSELPLQPKQNTSPAASWTNPAPVASNGTNAKLYWVPQGGKQFYEIARETLGDGTRWAEIWHLNPQYDTRYPVPGGTQLRLPPDAHP